LKSTPSGGGYYEGSGRSFENDRRLRSGDRSLNDSLTGGDLNKPAGTL
jgi:hypothetical protein